MKNTIKHIQLFAGIGGFGLAAQWMGWENVAHCEIDPFCQKVLKHHFPNSIQYGDIKTTDFSIHRGCVDVLTGGFPCQPFSVAGSRKGTEDSRHLWPEMLRAIREIQPAYIVGENVPGILNWSNGLVFEQVCLDMENEGYEVRPVILPACGLDAPHKRYRVWFVAKNTNKDGWGGKFRESEPGIWKFRHLSSGNNVKLPTHYAETKYTPHSVGISSTTGAERLEWEMGTNIDRRSAGSETEIITHTRCGGRAQDDKEREAEKLKHDRDATNAPQFGRRQFGNTRSGRPGLTDGNSDWQNFPTESPVRGKYDGVSSIMVRNIKSKVYATIRKDCTEEDLQEMLKAFSTPEVWQKIGGLYEIYEKNVLLQTVQLCQTPDSAQGDISPFGSEVSERLLRKLRKHKAFRCSPHGRKLEKQFRNQFADTLPFMSHEIALAAKEIQECCAKFSQNKRRQSIKGYGNAIVPQVAYQIFKAIESTF